MATAEYDDDPAASSVIVARGGQSARASDDDPGGPLPTPPQRPGILSRAWSSIADIGNEIANPTPYVADGPPGVGRQLAEGFVQGVGDVFAPPSAWLLRQAGVGDETTKAAADRRQQFEDQFGGSSTAASIGRAGGQTVATLPVLGAGGMAARTVAGAVPAIAPAVSFLGGATRAAPTANVVTRLGTAGASLAAQGALTGAAQGALTAGPDQSMAEGAAQGAGAGAIAGPVIGAASYPVRALAGTVANMTTAETADWARRAARFGIDIDPAKLTVNPTYRQIANQTGRLPFSGVNETAQRRQWQAAYARQFGETTQDGITYGVMDRAARRIGAVFDGVANRTTVQGGAPLQNDLINIAVDMPRYGVTEDQSRPIRAQFQNVLDAFNAGNGRIGGRAYQNLTQTGGPLDSVITSNDPTIAAFGMRIRNALDDAFQRSAAPADQAALSEARRQYRALKTVQPLVEQRGAMGDVNPNALKQRVIQQSRRFDPSTGGFAYTGGGDVGELADIGSIFFAPQPDSGTAARSLAIGLAGGGVVAGLTHPYALGATLASLGANRVFQAGIRSPAIGRAMIEGTLNPASRGAQSSNRALVPAAVGLLNFNNWDAAP